MYFGTTAYADGYSTGGTLNVCAEGAYDTTMGAGGGLCYT